MSHASTLENFPFAVRKIGVSWHNERLNKGLLKPLHTIVRGVSGERASMRPTDASLSDSYTFDRCRFSSLATRVEFLTHSFQFDMIASMSVLEMDFHFLSEINVTWYCTFNLTLKKVNTVPFQNEWKIIYKIIVRLWYGTEIWLSVSKNNYEWANYIGKQLYVGHLDDIQTPLKPLKKSEKI